MTAFPKKTAAALFAVTAFAQPALAQDGPCAGIGASGIWIGGDETGSDIATSDSFLEQTALVIGGNIYVSLFTVSTPTDVRVEAAATGAGDTVISLFDDAGALVLTDDDSGGNANSRGDANLPAGTYCLQLESYDNGPMTAQVRASRTDQDALTAGISIPTGEETYGNCDTAEPMGTVGDSVTAPASVTPFWSFTLSTPSAVSLRADNTDADPVLTLYDAAGTYITENDDFDGLNAQIDLPDMLDAGSYCVRVDALGNADAPITVSLTAYDPQAALLSLYRNGEAAPPLDGDTAFTDLGALDTRIRQDVQISQDVSWFTLDIEDSSLLVVEAIATGDSDPWVVIYDDLGREIVRNDDYGAELDSLAMARVSTGTYLLGIKDVAGAGGFVRLVVERYIRAP